MTDDIRKPVNWRVGKARFGVIKKGQVWLKRDTERRCEVVGKAAGGHRVVFDSGTLGRTHLIRERDLYRYYVREE